jgi:hypothetical protein
VTIHPEHGVVVSVPPVDRRGWARPEASIARFLGEREAWVRRHLADHARQRAALAARPAVDAGRVVPYRGVPHRIRLAPAPPGLRRCRVSRVRADSGDELLVEVAAADRRTLDRVLEAWFRDRARDSLDEAVARHAPALGVRPTAVSLRDPRSRWGSCSRAGRLSFSWRLVLAPPEALETVAVHELCHLRVFGHGPRFRALLASRVPDHAAWRRWLRRNSSELHAALDETAAAA